MKQADSGEVAIAERYQANIVRIVRGLIWLYLLLLIFEGAFRKWITPGMSAPLLVIRDPVVIMIYFVALIGGIFPKSRFVTSLIAIMILAMGMGLLAESFDLTVYLFGLRTNFLHLPLIFVMGRVMNYNHVVGLGRGILIMSIPMTFLVVKQFQASPDDILNTTAGGNSRQIETSGGKMRASGTFSFVAGVVCFYAVVSGFLLNSLMRRGTYSIWLQLIVLAAVIAAVATSGSRSALAGVIVVAGAVVLVVVTNPALLGRILMAAALIALVTLLVFQFAVVEEGVGVMKLRFKEASYNENLWQRVFGGYLTPFYDSFDGPFFGYGLGLGTNAGSVLATGRISFLMGESEWGRVLLESGPIVGLSFILWRISLVVYLLRISLIASRQNNLLPMLMFGASAMFILNGQLGQPTILGFAALGGGLCLAAANSGETETDSGETSVEEVDRPKRIKGRVRSRSPYAEALHRKT